MSSAKIAPGIAHAERRTSARYSCHIVAQCEAKVPGRGQVAWRGQVSDISAGGLGLHLQRRFEPGTILTIALPQPVGTMLARVAHVRPGPAGWFLGCEFAEKLSDSTAQALSEYSLQPLSPAACG